MAQIKRGQTKKQTCLAVFHPEEEGGYFVNFPDIAGCFTEGDDREKALFMATDVLALRLAHWEGKSPRPTKHKKVGPWGELVPVPLDQKLFFKCQPRTTINATLPTDLTPPLDSYRAKTGEDGSPPLPEGARLILE
ncbi:MAG: hypothetical protein A2600_13210 [Candidatus Lambdaproteobacteria bacterium RIFOXYD1_FULL_56_27]|uniref:Uncharacterized protein n=1 Tax=Candidatus Lambdaproteobacteria bacterium RIFOXYD2_FULL_56_26 TaxID=1817773 RepID=A0A1F6GLJ5_9PROT|nr:MAG: hypothetical protein A2557_01240 [Candidatus Lambdaproteobacteria bacterium RIFOXYD2_FULL_56_26]OGH03418.1 MAG: hypothetical protein A2426_03015 [Candidatus Lambdaproteobacteria bacterium RIFOXYC1_FULL_56_13]OGH08900.1 MAG: hypothetical protein A2600_13210 [Candidatus Lambdaproteobacteria bacterium RIFOXYD1_FULL_56_27]